jgi:PKHD-type hydroxylase
MLVHIPGVLDSGQVALCAEQLGCADWRDGRVTAGPQSAKAKANEQVDESCPEGRALGDMIVTALERNPLFLSAALPRRVFPPLFNRYRLGMGFGSHIDNAIRRTPTGQRMRTDLSATLFLSDPESYDGGELIVEDTYGDHAVKLPAGDLIVYPASSVHRVAQVTAGVRLAAFFWVQSLVRDDSDRALLYQLDEAVRQLTGLAPNAPALVSLTGCYHNLVRRWAEI